MLVNPTARGGLSTPNAFPDRTTSFRRLIHKPHRLVSHLLQEHTNTIETLHMEVVAVYQNQSVRLLDPVYHRNHLGGVTAEVLQADIHIRLVECWVFTECLNRKPALLGIRFNDALAVDGLLTQPGSYRVHRGSLDRFRKYHITRGSRHHTCPKRIIITPSLG